jgi:AraC family transcriptional regulator, regulatory protein of adaptative response / DNA-3-methyladenine glycosylase II
MRTVLASGNRTLRRTQRAFTHHVRKPLDKRRGGVQHGAMLPDHATCYRAIAARDTRFDGYLFTGVKTTGIYCRPVCPARLPKSSNVTFYPSAAAAQEAGLRPCLRCRPETAPDTPAWRGTSATIGRALRLIDEGALDEHGVDHLAMRLGIGDRQLRRLFIKHVGATPIAVAQTRRTLLAKQLLHETQLPMAQVALGAGFGSIRRFNEVFQDLFGRPPMEIRRGLVQEVPHGVGSEIALKLRFRSPYDWEGVSGFSRARLYHGIEAFEGDVYCRSFSIDGHVGIVRVGPCGVDWLNVRVTCSNLIVLARVISSVRRAFDLSGDPLTINEHLSADPLMAKLVTRRPGLRLVSSWGGFEGVVRAVLGQQITVQAAIGLGNELVRVLGHELPTEIATAGPITHVFPEAVTVASADLSFLKMPRSRQRTLQAVAQAFVDQPNLLEGEGMTVRTRLNAITGIGPWTLDYIALRVLNDPDALPSTDVALIRAFGLLTGELATGDLLACHGKNWQPWRSYASQHLWASLADA